MGNIAPRDANQVPSMLGIDDVTGLPVPVLCDSSGNVMAIIAGGGSGTVSSVSVVTANGVSGSVANPSTTPAITITLGAITPTSVNGLTVSTTTGTLTIAAGKILTASNSLTFTGTDGSSVAFGTGGTVLYGNQSITLSGDVTGSGTTAITTAVAKIAGTAVSGTTGSTNVVFSNSPTLVSPVLGAATGTSVVLAGAAAVSSFSNTSDSASLQAVKLVGARATPTANDEIYLSYNLNNSTPASKEFARISGKATTVTAASEVSSLDFYTQVAGTLTNQMRLISGALMPTTNAGITLGIATNNWGNVFLTNGNVIAWRDGSNSASNMTLTHATGSLTFAGGNVVGLGATTATTFNGLAITANGTNTLNITAGKTLAVTQTLTLSGTDSTTMTFPATSASIARTDAGQTFTGVQAMTSPDVTTSLTTPSATFGLLSANATTINFAGASGAIVNLGGGANAAELRFLEPSGGGSNFTSFKAQAQSVDLTYTLPAAQGAASTFLQNNGSGGLSWAAATGGASSQTLVDGTNISWDMNSGVYADVTLGGNRTLNNATNIAKNQLASLKVYQDSVGSRTLAYGSQYQFNGATPVLSTGPLLMDYFEFSNDGSNQYSVMTALKFGATFAYFAGGDTTSLASGVVADTQALDFASDTTTMVTKGALTQARDGLGAGNSATVAYFAGGETAASTQVTTTDGLNFATDTTAQTTRGAMSTAKSRFGCVNSSTNCYFSGGITSGASVSNTQSLTFASDTSTQVTKGALTTLLCLLSGTNSSTVGYFSAGSTNSSATNVQTTTNGLTFATDTNAQVTKGVLSTAKFMASGANSSTVGYYAGGQNSGAARLTTDQGLTFASDTTTMVTKGVLGTASGNMAAGHSGANAYFSGGNTGAAVIVGVTNDLVFATDTTTMVTKGALSTAKEYAGAAQGSKLGLTQIP